MLSNTTFDYFSVPVPAPLEMLLLWGVHPVPEILSISSNDDRVAKDRCRIPSPLRTDRATFIASGSSLS